ncbi:MAG TPA: hypothetical protein DDZ88_26805 [Verrucomicrobiales bacterium]|nr:hypothetical protein [Verrucomicrobiales bacterium]
MLVLDTNHLTEIDLDTPKGHELTRRLAESSEEHFLPIVVCEEILRGWLALLHKARSDDEHVYAYSRFGRSLAELNRWTLLEWDQDTAAIFARLRSEGIRIATLDLRIASIALAYDATLLSRNLRDFRLVPGLKVENWLD